MKKDGKEYKWWLQWWNKYPDRLGPRDIKYPGIDREFVCDYPVDFRLINPKNIWAKKKIIVYVHIPFCKNICKFCCYCKYLNNSKKVNSYLRALKKEISIYSQFPYIQDTSVKSIFFGGGTPTTLDENQLIDLFRNIRACLNIESNAEITIESHPKTISENKIKTLLALGINRINFGVQTFNDKLLSPPLFYHKKEDAIRAIQMAQQNSSLRVGIDLLYRLPGQNMQDWKNDLVQALHLGVTSISCYSLLWPPNSAPPELPNQEEDKKMDELAVEYLTKNGYQQWATCEFSLPGKECSYIKGMWHAPQPELLAFGVGAISYIHGYTYVNLHSLDKYIEFVESNKLPVLMGKKLTKEEEMSRFLVLGLKCLSIEKKKFRDLYGTEIENFYSDVLEDLQKKSLISVNEKTINLTERGKRYIDYISKAFYTQNNTGKPQTVGVLLQDDASLPLK